MSRRVPINATRMEDIKQIGKKGKGSLPEPVKDDINVEANVPKKEGPKKRNSAPQAPSAGVESHGSGWF